MKKLLSILVVALMFFSCTSDKYIHINISNTSDVDRLNEIIELSMNGIDEYLNLDDTTQIVVLATNGEQLPYQITYDGLLIFPVSVAAHQSTEYIIQPGNPDIFSTLVHGQFYPERKDDLAWENDKMAYRAYGPALQQSGEKAYGYDIWTKNNTTDLVVEARYEAEIGEETQAKIEELKALSVAAADSFYRTVSYHIDHGNGMDCYKVGPTLGGGANGLMKGDTLIYPYAFAEHEILDNGPLRFTVQLTYHPFSIDNDKDVVETRIISMDAYSYLNKAVITYENISEPTPIATGLVLHEPQDVAEFVTNKRQGYITYVDPTDNLDVDNGKIYVGAVFPETLLDAKAQWFSEEEKKTLRGGAYGHVLAISEYMPNADYIYYFGSAWSKGSITTPAEWNQYISNRAKALKEPLVITLQ